MFNELIKTINKTKGVKTLRDCKNKFVNYEITSVVTKKKWFEERINENRLLNYYLSKTELFARAYAQYIATKSGNTSCLKRIIEESKYVGKTDGKRTTWISGTQWSKSDFLPVIKAFDKLFVDAKWKE